MWAIESVTSTPEKVMMLQDDAGYLQTVPCDRVYGFPVRAVCP